MNDNTINTDVTMDSANATVLAGRYRVVRQLGQGGMGSVWLAEDEKLDNHRVAIKMLPAILVTNKRAYQQVKSEALVSLKLSHANIVTVRSFEEENGNPFLVMDYIDGETLDDYLAEKGKLSEEETIRLLTPVAAALDYAHGEGVIHRDVKPANVMIRKDGHPFVLDFGIAREIQETMTRMTGKLSSGTLLYMSPEQLHGAEPTPAQDVYSFAAMVYECLSGHPPFSRGQIEYQIDHDTPPPLDPNIAICGLVMAALAKTPDGRPKSCTALLARDTTQPDKVAEPPQQETSTTKRSSGNILEQHQHQAAALAAFERGDYESGMREAAQSGKITDPALQFYIGYCYDYGKGVAKNATEAVKWYRKSAEQGYASAQYNLGACYAKGDGVAKDAAEAVRWYRKAGEQGLAEAQYNLGVRYEIGNGVAKDLAEAAKWFCKAAAQGHEDAKALLNEL